MKRLILILVLTLLAAGAGLGARAAFQEHDASDAASFAALAILCALTAIVAAVGRRKEGGTWASMVARSGDRHINFRLALLCLAVFSGFSFPWPVAIFFGAAWLLALAWQNSQLS